VTSVVETVDKVTGKVVFTNQGTVVLRGCGGFGGQKNGAGMFLVQQAIGSK
jgi:hypothetical protein